MRHTKDFRGDFFAVDTDGYIFINGVKCREERIFEKAREIKAPHGIAANCYDVNSMYPAFTGEMPASTGEWRVFFKPLRGEAER